MGWVRGSIQVVWDSGETALKKPPVQAVPLGPKVLNQERFSVCGEDEELVLNWFISQAADGTHRNQQNQLEKKQPTSLPSTQATVSRTLSLFLLLFFLSFSFPVASAKNLTSSLASISRWRNCSAALLKPITS